MLDGVFIRPLAWRDINQELDYLRGHAGDETATRFFDQFLISCETLARMPRMAPLCGFTRKATRRLRRWPVKDFDNWLIFYQVRREGIDVVHVFHGARDIYGLLDG